VRTVLVIEDYPELRGMIAKLLERQRFSVAQAGDGAEAMMALRNQNFDLVVTDLALPGMSGLQLLRQLKYLRPHARVIAMSGVSVNHLQAAKAAGANEILRKPFTPQQMMDAINRLLPNA
jgi:CheY-like chemotaxis protein